jgi:hypothetical protein
MQKVPNRESRASAAVELKPDELDSRHLIAKALNRFDPSDPEGEAHAQLAALWFEILSPLGFEREPLALNLRYFKDPYWTYADDGSSQLDGWQSPGFDDTSWQTGVGAFGYGDEREETGLNQGTSGARPTTAYFRTKIAVDDLANFANPVLRYQRDDGVVI